MTDAELQEWWPALGAVVAELRGTDRSAVADLLVDAVAAGASSSEILGGVGLVLRGHHGLRSRLSASGASAWDEVLADVHRAYPLRRLADRLARLGRGRPPSRRARARARAPRRAGMERPSDPGSIP